MPSILDGYFLHKPWAKTSHAPVCCFNQVSSTITRKVTTENWYREVGSLLWRTSPWNMGKFPAVGWEATEYSSMSSQDQNINRNTDREGCAHEVSVRTECSIRYFVIYCWDLIVQPSCYPQMKQMSWSSGSYNLSAPSCTVFLEPLL